MDKTFDSTGEIMSRVTVVTSEHAVSENMQPRIFIAAEDEDSMPMEFDCTDDAMDWTQDQIHGIQAEISRLADLRNQYARLVDEARMQLTVARENACDLVEYL